MPDLEGCRQLETDYDICPVCSGELVLGSYPYESLVCPNENCEEDS